MQAARMDDGTLLIPMSPCPNPDPIRPSSD